MNYLFILRTQPTANGMRRGFNGNHSFSINIKVKADSNFLSVIEEAKTGLFLMALNYFEIDVEENQLTSFFSTKLEVQNV